MNEDSELLRRYVDERAEDAFAEIVRRHIGLVYHAALRQTGDVSLAEEVTQVVFADLARKASGLTGRSSITGWLFTSARFAATKAKRGERRRQAREQEIFAMHEFTQGSSAAADWERLRPVIDEALHALDERDREAVLLRFFEGRPLAEVGAKLAMSEDTARVRVARALDKLQGLLARRGITSTTAALGVAMSAQAGVTAPVGLAVSVTAGALATAGIGALGWGAVAFMGTTKMAVGIIGVVAVVGIGAALLGSNRAGEARAELAGATRTEAALRAKLGEVEGRAEVAMRRVQVAEAENARLLAAADEVKAVVVKAELESVTSGMVTARFKRAQTLILENGDPAEALREFLWCYDVEMPRISGMSGVRSTAPMLLAKLGERYPPALEALRERRDKAKERSSKNEKDFEAVMEFGSINRALNDDAANVALYDQLPQGDRRRSTLAFSSRNYLVEKQRYADAVAGLSYGQMSSSFERTARESPIVPSGSNAGEYRAPGRDYVIAETAKSIEVLAGAGDLANARSLAQRLLAYDNSEATRALIQKHAARAGQPGLITATLASP
jgi:RNA polymerase sigma factor (sigma-70 family)